MLPKGSPVEAHNLLKSQKNRIRTPLWKNLRKTSWKSRKHKGIAPSKTCVSRKIGCIFAVLQHLPKRVQNGLQMDVEITLKSLEIRVRGFSKATWKVCLKMDTTNFNQIAILKQNLSKMTSKSGLVILTVEVLFEYFFPSWLHEASGGAPTPKITSF